MNVPVGRRARVALVLLAAVGVSMTASLPAFAAGGAPVTPTDLRNGNNLPCAADPNTPLYYNPVNDFTVEGVPSDTNPSEYTVTEQFQIWPVSNPTQVASWSLSASSGSEALLNVPGSTFADGQTYAWQAATVADGTTSAWSAPCYVAVDETSPANPPTITSSNYLPGVSNQGGAPIHVTFGANGVSDVMGYTFTWVGTMPVAIPPTSPLPDPFTGPAGTVMASSLGGSATINLIPPDGSSYQRLTVVSFDRSFNPSTPVDYNISIKSTAPTVKVRGALPNFGKPTTFLLQSNPALEAQSPVASYDVRVVGGNSGQQELTVSADADGSAQVDVTIDSTWGEWLDVSSKSADGWISDQYQYLVSTAPIVKSDVYAENASSGGVGVTGTFTFSPPVNDVVSYSYSFDYGATQTTVPAHGGRARICWTPTASGQYVIEVYAILKDGTQLAPYDYFFTVS